MNSLRIIIEQSVEWRTPLYCIFIDFSRAFDTLHHEAIWTALQCKGIPEEMIDIIRGLYRNAVGKVLHGRTLGTEFRICDGVRQGCILSPLLFNIVLDMIMKQATSNRKVITWGVNGRLQDLDYANDICISPIPHIRRHDGETVHSI